MRTGTIEPTLAEDPENRPDLASELARWLAEGAAAHPGVTLGPDVRAFLGERADALRGAQAASGRAADVVLAAACAAGNPVAIASFDAMLPGIARPALARIGVPASDHDEIIQRVRVALLTPTAARKVGFAGYSGRGDLRAYIRAVAVRIAHKRREREESPHGRDDSDALAFLPAADDSPELRMLKARCRNDVRAGFAAAVAELSPRERTLLRQHYVDGLGIDALGPLYGVHRATCARWIEAARTKILRGIRDHLRGALGLGSTELESAIELVRSQLDLSLSRL
jgi:RNA polymerase sigma-70 factor, ECF subfamily